MIGYAEAPFTQLFLNSFLRVNLKMPCLLTNLRKPGISVFEAASCYYNGVLLQLPVLKGGTLALPIFLKVCNTTFEVCNLRVKEEPQQPGTYKLFFCYYTSVKILTCFLSFQLVAVCFYRLFEPIEVFHYSS